MIPDPPLAGTSFLRNTKGGVPARIAFVGAGPAGIMVLERILASRNREHPELPLEIHLIDPYPPGGGRIWRRSQSPLLKLNTTLQDSAVFTDASCTIEGPILPGPTFAEWVAGVRAGKIPRPEWSDDALEHELSVIEATDFPTRRLNNAYLSWAFEEIVRRAGEGISITWHQNTVTKLRRSDSGARRLVLADGQQIEADIVLLMLGHNGSGLNESSARILDFATRHSLSYVPPAFTADIDFDWIEPGQDVIVRGMGLAAVDLAVLLCEGRGGIFNRDELGALKYARSGREPRLHFGSRRGVPYHSKVTSSVSGEAVTLSYLGDEFREYVSNLPRLLDFDQDVWPRVCAELLTGYYRELYTGHPERVRGSWRVFSERLRGILAGPEGHESRALGELIAEYVPFIDDRFDIRSFDRPLAADVEHGEVESEPPTESRSVHDLVVDHIERDLRQRTSPDGSAAQALFLTALYSYIAIAEIPAEKWNARSRAERLPGRWHTFFSFLASGPPGERLEELLALSEAGVVQFLGGEVTLKLNEQQARFEASGVARGGGRVPGRAESTARVLVDAWLPEAHAATSDNAFLRDLISQGVATELQIEDGAYRGSTGQLLVNFDGSLPADPRVFALGAFTSLPVSGAFTRPGIDALPFRVHDRCARAVLRQCVEVHELRVRSEVVAM